MVSHRNFISIAAIMLAILFMFQFSNIALVALNDYDDNEYAVELSDLSSRSDAYNQTGAEETVWKTQRPSVVFVGAQDSAMRNVVKTWAEYTKQTLVEAVDLNSYSVGEPIPEMIVIDAAKLNWNDKSICSTLKSYTDQGINLVFASLPEVSVINENRELMELLGIKNIMSESTTVKGIHLYKGFLLGGESIYMNDEKDGVNRQDMELQMPWYELSKGTKSYMRGIPHDDETDAEDYPAVIWRKSLDNDTYVFAVNGSYMEDVAGIGILSAMLAETNLYTVYPVVNAQNLVVANYPGFALENGEELTRLYSHSMHGLFRDVLWIDITSAYRQNKLGLTCMMAPQFDYSDNNLPDQGQLVYYMKYLNELGAEIGLSGFNVSETPLIDKLTNDFGFLDDAQLKYKFSSFYTGNLDEKQIMDALGWADLSSVRTIVSKYDGDAGIIGYETENVTKQTAVNDIFNHTFMSDLRLKSVETVLAYSNVMADVSRVVYPRSDNDTWNNLSVRFTSDISTFWQPFKVFDGTTISESDGRIRNFLALDYTHSYDGENVTVKHSGEGSSWFILRVNHGAADNVTGGKCQKIEDGVYLIEATDGEVTVKLSGAYLD